MARLGHLSRSRPQLILAAYVRLAVALNHPEFEEIQRANLIRKLGAALYSQAAEISDGSVDAVAAVINRMESLHDADLDAVASEFARAVVAGRADDHLITLQQADSNRP